jgi:diphthamide biosynthesis methyltransferase
MTEQQAHRLQWKVRMIHAASILATMGFFTYGLLVVA